MEIHNMSFDQVETLSNDRDWWRKYALRLMWENLRLVKHLPGAVAEQIHIEAVVNEMDPDFSFERDMKTL
ncbi:MAG TPA: hypothetical protein VGO68_07300 [Pyrinomonadaceae bacterium]|jgi:hypothetical protein|nr:hypothetical protein [Pyrinomonadaceae bacterium]